MASQVQIAKLALQHIGDRYDISDLLEATTEAEQINLVYDDTRRELLRSHPWRFANKFVSPATLDIVVPAYWGYAYQYPTDAVRVIEIVNPLGRDLDPIEFEVTLLADDTKAILTDQQNATFRYTKDIADTTRFDPEFINAFSFLLASKVAMPLTGDLNIRNAMREEAMRAISQAGSIDANEGRTQTAPEASWIDARNGY